MVFFYFINFTNFHDYKNQNAKFARGFSSLSTRDFWTHTRSRKFSRFHHPKHKAGRSFSDTAWYKALNRNIRYVLFFCICFFFLKIYHDCGCTRQHKLWPCRFFFLWDRKQRFSIGIHWYKFSHQYHKPHLKDLILKLFLFMFFFINFLMNFHELLKFFPLIWFQKWV